MITATQPLEEPDEAGAEPARTKPSMRGVSHQIGAFVALIAGLVLVASVTSTQARVATAVYAASLVAMLGISALYHRRHWPPGPRRWMKRLDHSAIFVLIAGTYTPICLLVLESEVGVRLLVVAWAGAALGVARALFWVSAPKPLSAALYVLLGWLVVVEWRAVAQGLGGAGVAWLMAGGAAYTLGAVVYALRRPDPIPKVFGFHEIFHVFVLVGAACHYAMIARLV